MPVVLPTWVWVSFAIASAGGALLVATTDKLKGSKGQWIALGVGAIGSGLCIWKAARTYRYGFWAVEPQPVDPALIVPGDPNDFTEDEELWAEATTAFTQLYERLFLGDDPKEEQREFCQLLGRYTALQVREVCRGTLDEEWDSSLMQVTVGSPAYMRDLIGELVQGEGGGALFDAVEGVGQTLMGHFERSWVRRQREPLFKQLADRIDLLLKTVRESERTGGAPLHALQESWDFPAIRIAEDEAEGHRHEVAYWRDQYTRLLLSVLQIKDGHDPAAARHRRLVIPFLAEGMAVGTVHLAEWVVSREGIDTYFGLIKETMEAEAGEYPLDQAEFLNAGEEEAVLSVIRSFLQHASGAGTASNLLGWFKSSLFPSVNFGMEFLFYKREDESQDFNPVLLNGLLETLIKQVEEPPSAAQQRAAGIQWQQERADIDHYYRADLRTTGWSWTNRFTAWMGGVHPGLKWTRGLLLDHPEVGRLFLYRVIADLLQNIFPGWDGDVRDAP